MNGIEKVLTILAMENPSLTIEDITCRLQAVPLYPQ